MGDQTVVAGWSKKTYRFDRLFSSISQCPIPSVAFFSFALISTASRRAVPLCIKQLVYTDAERAAAKAKASLLSARP